MREIAGSDVTCEHLISPAYPGNRESLAVAAACDHQRRQPDSTSEIGGYRDVFVIDPERFLQESTSPSPSIFLQIVSCTGMSQDRHLLGLSVVVVYAVSLLRL